MSIRSLLLLLLVGCDQSRIKHAEACKAAGGHYIVNGHDMYPDVPDYSCFFGRAALPSWASDTLPERLYVGLDSDYVRMRATDPDGPPDTLRKRTK